CPPNGVLSGQTCTITTTTPANVQFSCVDGSAVVNGFCNIRSVQTAWTNTCAAYQNAGGAPVTP
ncbi:hypothetical protein, partial [Halovibrio sp. HP20-50]|uniref:hypothetical protein n=1 Tax=Halovibrio sp. HP20-59 TaxID=3080275 RepID=UPI00294B0D2F